MSWRPAARRLVEPLVLVLILAVGSYLRLASIEFAQFRMDDATLWAIASQLAHQPQILTHGLPASVEGFANGPFQAYLLLPATLLSANPLAAYILVAVVNILSIVVFWAFVRSYWGSGLALMAAALYAVNPWAVVLSRRLLGNDLLALFTVLLVWSLCDLARHGRRRDSVLPLVWLAIAVQVYVAALSHIVLAAFAILVGARRLRVPYFLAGFLLFAVLMAPYILGVLGPNFAELTSAWGSSGDTSQVDFTSLLFTLHSVSAEGYQAFANNAGLLLDASQGVPKVVSWLAEALLVIGTAIAMVEALRAVRRRRLASALPTILVLGATLLPTLLLVRHNPQIHVYYLLTGFPMPFVLVSLGLRGLHRALIAALARRPGTRRVVPHVALAASLGFIVGTHLLLSQVFFVAIREYWPKADYGLPLRYALDFSSTIKALA